MTRIVSLHPDLDIQVTRCMASGNNVIIDFIFTNHAMDTYIDFYTRSTIAFDDLGNQYTHIGMRATDLASRFGIHIGIYLFQNQWEAVSDKSR